jgi:chromosome segregation ATPase
MTDLCERLQSAMLDLRELDAQLKSKREELAELGTQVAVKRQELDNIVLGLRGLQERLKPVGGE